MSEQEPADQGTPTPPESSASQPPTQDNQSSTNSTSRSTADTFNQALKVASQYWLKIQPVLQDQGARFLRFTSQTLNGLADRLEQARATATPSAATTEPLPFEETLTKIWKTIEPLVQGIPARLQDLFTRLKPLLLRLEELWLPYLAKIKTRLPESIQTQFSDRALTGFLAGLLFFVLWTLNGILGGHPQPIAQAPSAQPVQIAQRSVKPMAPLVNPSPEPVRSPVTVAAQETQAPIATPIRRKSSAPTPAVPVSRSNGTGDSLKDAFVTVSTPYVEDLILSVLPDAPSHRLTLKVSSGWYDLEAQEQDQLAQDLLRSSQRLRFDKLEIQDSQNELLARTPVVGDQIVIFRRHKVTTS